MGFSIETVLFRGRPTSAQLEQWVRAALPRLSHSQFFFEGGLDSARTNLDVTLYASGLIEADRPEALTLLWTQSEVEPVPRDDSLMSFEPFFALFRKKRSQPDGWSPIAEGEGLPPVPPDARGPDPSSRHPFFVTIAQVAKAATVDSAFFADSSISGSGALVIPGQPAVVWTEHDNDAKREVAEKQLKEAFGADAPTVEELQWVGPGKPFWSRPILVNSRRAD